MSHLVIGIDEAGYGPTLGPLIISAAVFGLPQPRFDLWKALRSVITHGHKKTTDKLIVCDSKLVYQPARGIGLLEKTVLAFLRQSMVKHWPIPARKLIRYLDPLTQRNCYYENSSLEIPLMATPAKIEQYALVLQREMARKSIKFYQVVCRIIEVAEFNQFIKTSGNKADLLFFATTQLINYIYKTYSSQGRDKSQTLDFYIGKQGGRTYYRDLLTKLFDNGKIQTIKETPAISSYRFVTQKGIKSCFRFIKDGEEAHFTIALASMYAKYLREVLMCMFNNFYQQYLTTLKPTAGYPQDAKRFIEDITPVINQLNLNPETFIRAK